LFICLIKFKVSLCFLVVGPSMVQEKSSLIRRSLSYRVKSNRSNVYVKKKHILISGIRFTYKFVIPYTNRGQKRFFRIFWNIGLVLMAWINWLLKPKCMLIHILFWNFFCCVKIWCYNIYIYILERLGRILKQNIF